MEKKLHGRHAIVTGGTQGLGLAIARAYVRHGAHVYICAREAERLELAAEDLRTVANGEVRIESSVADVSDDRQIGRMFSDALTKFGRVEIVVCNAGLFGPIGPFESADLSDWVYAIRVNLLGTAYLSRLAIRHFKEAAYGKLLFLSGGGATKGMPFFSAYAASKAAVVRLGETLADEVRASNIDVNCVAPGALNTRLLAQILEAGAQNAGRDQYASALKQQETGGASIERAAEMCVFLASSESDGITGRLISAVWDPWEGLKEHREELARSDVYTLRRIAPEDRGLNWKKH